MRVLLIILITTILAVNSNGQNTFSVTFPKKLKSSFSYLSPCTIYRTAAPVIGILKKGEPFDSVNSETSGNYLFTSDFNNTISDSSRKEYSNQHGLKIIVDTSQEISRKESFYEDDGTDSIKYVTLIQKSKNRKLSSENYKTLKLSAIPVYIINATGEHKNIYDQDLYINIVQEVRDYKGNWQAIETFETGACGMAWGWKKLPPNYMIITSILKYGGSFKTIGRVKFYNGTIYYSEPYSISVNPALLSRITKTSPN